MKPKQIEPVNIQVPKVKGVLTEKVQEMIEAFEKRTTQTLAEHEASLYNLTKLIDE